MIRFRRPLLALLAVLAAVIVGLACGSDRVVAGAREGSVEVVSTLGSALSAADVDTVTLTIVREAPAHHEIKTNLVRVGSRWQATVGKIPIGSVAAGTAWTFRAEAFHSNAPAQILYRAVTEGVDITTTDVGLVVLVLQQVDPPLPFDNVAPLLDSMFIGTRQPAFGDVITITAGAHDPNTGDTLTFTFSATGPFAQASDFTPETTTTGAGSAAVPATASTQWRPPGPGAFTITLLVRDQKAAHTGISFTLVVIDPGTASSASSSSTSSSTTSSAGGTTSGEDPVVLTAAGGINTWPVVSGLVSTNAYPLGPGNVTTTLTLTALDSDGDRLHAVWTLAGCTGAFTPPEAAVGGIDLSGATTGVQTSTLTLTRTDSDPATQTCLVTATVTDGFGGTNSGQLTVQLGQNVPAGVQP